MKMKNNQKVFMREFMDDFLRLQEKYYNPENDDQYWDGLVSDAMDVIESHKTSDARQNKFCQTMILEFVKSREE